MVALHIFLFAILAPFFAIVSASPIDARATTFHNPIKQGSGADPWVTRYNDDYYMMFTTGGNVWVTKSHNLAGPWPQDSQAKVYDAVKAGYGAVWAPELHRIGNTWYIYVAMAGGDKSNKNHRMYVLQGTSDDPLKPFNLVGKINSPDDNWAIDGTVLQYQNGKLYFIWSGWSDSSSGNIQNLYIAPMSSPTKISGNRVLLHQPIRDWQFSGSSGINEGPEILVHEGRTFLVYSAAGSWTDKYQLAFMGIDNGADPLNPKNWWRLDDRPVMWSSDKAYGPGHASFTTDRKGTPYVIYHANEVSGTGWGGRTIRAQPFGWNKDKSPAFPRPVGFDTALPMPA